MDSTKKNTHNQNNKSNSTYYNDFNKYLDLILIIMGSIFCSLIILTLLSLLLKSKNIFFKLLTILGFVFIPTIIAMINLLVNRFSNRHKRVYYVAFKNGIPPKFDVDSCKKIERKSKSNKTKKYFRIFLGILITSIILSLIIIPYAYFNLDKLSKITREYGYKNRRWGAKSKRHKIAQLKRYAIIVTVIFLYVTYPISLSLYLKYKISCNYDYFKNKK